MKKVEFKAEYVQPQTEVIEMELLQMIATSGGSGTSTCSLDCEDDCDDYDDCGDFD